MRAMTRTAGLALALALAIGAPGCEAYVRGNATVTTPTLVLIETDLWVIENYDEPVFYTDGYYWRFSSGIWYRSHVHYQGWVSVSSPPSRLHRIDQPTRYVHYVAPPRAQKRVGPPDHAPAHGVRGTQPGHQRKEARTPPPGPRDNAPADKPGRGSDRDKDKDNDKDKRRGGPK